MGSALLTAWLVAACRGPEEVKEPGATARCLPHSGLFASPTSINAPSEGCGRVFLDQIELVGEGDLKLELFTDGDSVVLQAKGGEGGALLRGARLKGTWDLAGEGPVRVWQQGFQSWSASGVFEPPAKLEVQESGWLVGGGAQGAFAVAEEVPGTSWWALAAGRPQGASLLVGALSAGAFPTRVGLSGQGNLQVDLGGPEVAIPLAPGQLYFFDRLWIGFDPDPNALWADWAERAAVLRAPRASLEVEPPVGWSSWTAFFTEVSRDRVVQQLPLLPAGSLVQIDDGWQRAWGDWSANDRFPDGMASMAAELRAQGFQPGLWMAPLHVSRDLPLYAEHDDWWLRDAAGAEVSDNGYAVIDTTHPEALAWVLDQVQRQVDAGYDYLKLDFLYAGAMEGQRNEPLTGVEAYRAFTDALRGRLGDEVWILACGAPFLPSLGFADSFRTGPDIAFVALPDPNPAFVRSQLRSTAARSFTNGRWWWVDADTTLLRSPLNDDQARGAVASLALSGGSWLLGDDLASLDPARLALGLPLDPLRGSAAAPEDPWAFVSGFDTSPVLELAQGDDSVPDRWSFPDGTIGLVNLTASPREVTGPGGTELLTGAASPPGPRLLPPGAGELWRP